MLFICLVTYSVIFFFFLLSSETHDAFEFSTQCAFRVRYCFFELLLPLNLVLTRSTSAGVLTDRS